MRPWLIASVAGATVACTSDVTVALRDDQVALAAVLDAHGQVRSERWIEGSAGTRLSLPEDDTLVVVTLDRDAFTFRGEGSWHEHRPSLSLDAPCAVCLLPRTGAPQAALAGEACPLPDTADAQVVRADGGGAEAAEVAALRRRARLAWGTPACPRTARIGPPNGVHGTRYDQWLVDSGLAPTRVHPKRAEATTLDRALLDRFDLVLLEWPVRTYSSTEADALAGWLRDGGALVVTSGFQRDSSEPDRINALLSPLDITLVPPVQSGPLATFEAHPITTGLAFLDFTGGYGVETATATTLARTARGPVAVAAQRGAGRAVVWGDEWILSNFSFDASADAQTFWAQAIAWTLAR